MKEISRVFDLYEETIVYKKESKLSPVVYKHAVLPPQYRVVVGENCVKLVLDSVWDMFVPIHDPGVLAGAYFRLYDLAPMERVTLGPLLGEEVREG